MKRILAIFCGLTAVLFLCFLGYIKGHADGIHRSKVMNMGFDISCLEKLERGQIELAKSHQALFLWAALRSERDGESWLSEWAKWRRFDTKGHLDRARPKAEAIVTRYQATFMTVDDIKKVVEDTTGLPVEIQIK